MSTASILLVGTVLWNAQALFVPVLFPCADCKEEPVPTSVARAHDIFLSNLKRLAAGFSPPQLRCTGAPDGSVIFCGYSAGCVSVLIGGGSEKIAEAGLIGVSRGPEACSDRELRLVQTAFVEAFLSCGDPAATNIAKQRLLAAKVRHSKQYIQPGDEAARDIEVCGPTKARFFAHDRGDRVQETLSLMTYPSQRP
jgi:hypothetical protein